MNKVDSDGEKLPGAASGLHMHTHAHAHIYVAAHIQMHTKQNKNLKGECQ